MILNNVVIIASAKSVGAINKNTKGTRYKYFTPYLLGDLIVANINDKVYNVEVEDDYCPQYVVSTILNDSQKLGTFGRLTKGKNYKELSKYWTHIATGIPLKGFIKDNKLIVPSNVITKIYSSEYSKQNKNEYSKRDKT